MNIKETAPTVVPQIILIYTGASEAPSVIPDVERLDMAFVVESVAVIKDIKTATR